MVNDNITTGKKKTPFKLVTLTISMDLLNGYVELPEGRLQYMIVYGYGSMPIDTIHRKAEHPFANYFGITKVIGEIPIDLYLD